MMRAKELADRKPRVYSWLHRMLLRLDSPRDDTRPPARSPVKRASAPPGMPKTILAPESSV